MKCRICASECPPGAKLCRDCAAARKRAFAATVTQPLFAAAAPSAVPNSTPPKPAAAAHPAEMLPMAAGATISSAGFAAAGVAVKRPTASAAALDSASSVS